MTIEEFVKKDYALAVAELAKIKKGPLVKSLQRGPSPYNTEKLVYELSKLNFNPHDVHLQVTEIPAGSIVISENELLALKQMAHQSVSELEITVPKTEVVEEDAAIQDDVLKSFHQQRAAAWKEASFLQHELGNVELSTEDAYNKCCRVLTLTNVVIPELDAKEKYYKENGQLPVEKKPSLSGDEYPTLTGIELYKRIETLKKNISRDKKNNPDKLPKWESELAVRSEQLKVETNGPTQ